MIFETHAHYDDKCFDGDRDEILRRSSDMGVGLVVNVSSSIKGVKDTLRLMGRYGFMYGSAGIHPSEVMELDDDNFKWLANIVRKYKYINERGINKDLCEKAMAADKHEKIVAVGEIGLDYHYGEPTREVQKYWFDRQLRLAVDEDMPVIIHSRDSAKDTHDMVCKAFSMAESYGRKLAGVLHCFSYGWDMAQEYVKMGLHIGCTGVVTFKNAKNLIEVVERIPLGHLVVETDAPYLAPVPNRGKRNDSTNLPYIITRIAEIKGMSAEEVEDATYKNALGLYRMNYNKHQDYVNGAGTCRN